MYYGEEKAFQMSRSLLPCSKRKSARDNKKRVAKKLRRKIKQKLSQIRAEDDYYDNHLDFDFYDDASIERGDMMWERRGRDKVGPFMNWAEAKAKHIPDGEKYHYIKSILPGSSFIIQDHAMSHLEWVKGFERNPAERWYWYSGRRRVNSKKISIGELKRHLYDIICDGRGHRALNTLLKRFHNTVTWSYTYEVYDEEKERVVTNRGEHRFKSKARTLLGIHDIDTFIADLDKSASARPVYRKARYDELNKKYRKLLGVDVVCWNKSASGRIALRNPNYHPEWKRVVSLFVREWIKMDEPDYESLEKIKCKFEDFRYNYYGYYSTNHKGFLW